MAIKPKAKEETKTVGDETADQDTTPDTGEGTTGEVEATAEGATTTEVKTKAPRRPWGATQEQVDARDAALASVLKQPRPNGSVMTAGSVAMALSRMPEFEGEDLNSTRVAARVKQIQGAIEAKGKTPPEWLRLDSARRTVNLDLFTE